MVKKILMHIYLSQKYWTKLCHCWGKVQVCNFVYVKRYFIFRYVQLFIGPKLEEPGIPRAGFYSGHLGALWSLVLLTNPGPCSAWAPGIGPTCPLP